MINYLKSIVYTLSIILGGTIVLTILNYFNILNGIPLKIVMLLIPIVGMFVGSFNIGRTASKKGYIEGLKYGGLLVILLIIINLLTKQFTILSIIYYVLLLLTSVLASILGINRKRT